MDGLYLIFVCQLLELKEKTKIVVEYPHPGIRKFSNIRLVCFSTVHLFCRNTQMRLLVQPHESCHKNLSKRRIFSLILMIYYVIGQKSYLIVVFCVLMPNYYTYTEYLFAHDESRIRKMQSGERIMQISLSALSVKVTSYRLITFAFDEQFSIFVCKRRVE